MFTEDLTPFFDTTGFALAGTLDGEAITVILDRATVPTFDNDLLTMDPSVTLDSAAAAAAAPGQELVVAGVTYTVREVQIEPPDGALTRLVLARA